MNSAEIKGRLYYELSEIECKIYIVDQKLNNIKHVKDWAELVLEIQYLYGIRDGLIKACNSLLERHA